MRTNLALADRAYRAGEYLVALEHIDLALARLLRRNANPLDAEALYLRGLVLRRLGRDIEAEQAWGKAGWDGTWAPGAGLALARSLAQRDQNRAALRVLDTLDGVIGHDTRRIALRATILRRVGQDTAADDLLASALRADPLDAELRAASGQFSSDAGIVLDVALSLRDAGAWAEALDALARAVDLPVTPSGNVRPIAHYIAAAIHDGQGRPGEATRERLLARQSDQTWAFPAGLDALDALDAAIAAEPGDAVAHALLGMLLYAHGRRTEAAERWERAVALGNQDAVLLRNAALAAYNIAHDDQKAWDHYVRAVQVAPDDARLRYEQDQLATRLGHSASDRLARLRAVENLVLTRDDFTIAYILLLAAEGDAARAHKILTTRPFHPWEGGEGQAIAAWDATIAALGRPQEEPPASLGETRAQYTAPVARHADGETDYFATSLPELLLFAREREIE